MTGGRLSAYAAADGGDFGWTSRRTRAVLAWRQIAGVFSQLEKTRLVKKLRGARQRKRQATGKKVEGRKSLAEMYPEAVKAARRLRRASPKTGERLSFREISARLAEAGHLNERGRPFNAQSVRAMIEGPQQRERRPSQ